ncbi:hypothetical protein D3C87_1271160 [compost metagenome]
MLRHEAAERISAGLARLFELPLQELPIDGVAHVRVHHRKVLEQQMLALRDHLGRVLVDDRHEPVVLDLPVAHVARVVELLLEHARGRIVRLRGQVDHKSFRARREAADRLTQHVLRVGDLSEQPELIYQRTDRLLPADRVGVGRYHLEKGVRRLVGDRLDVRLGVHQRAQFLINVRPRHVARRAEAVVGDFDRRRQDRELARPAPVQDQRRHHDPGGNRRLAVLLRDQDEPLSDQPPACLRVIGPEYRSNDVEHPLTACFAEGRATWSINNLQRLEHVERPLGLSRKQRRRDDRFARAQPSRPVWASS